VVVGDVLLDVDLEGDATRLSPDAPVPVLESLAEHPRPGGAGLAALMAAYDGHEVVLVTAVGDDDAGRRVRALLDGRVRLLTVPYDGPTPVKQRVRSGGQSLLRLDRGTGTGRVGRPGPEVETALRGAGAVLVADYGRGVAGAVTPLLGLLPGRTPLVWDPHPRGSAPVPGARLVTPNAAEAARFTADLVETCGRSPLAAAGQRAARLVPHWRAHAVAVTMGASGALLSYGEGAPVVCPAPRVTCVDPCGAGDRFSVTAAASLGEGRVPTEAVQDAVDAAAGYVAAGGPASLTGPDAAVDAPAETSAEEVIAGVRRAGGVVVATGGCFDLLHAGHVATLRAARGLGDCLVVCVNSDDSVRRLKGASRPLVPATDRVRVLQALECVDAVVVFDEDTPVEVLRVLRPDVWAKGGDYAGSHVPEADVLAEWGGQAVVLPYLEGRSTTRLVQTAVRTTAES
jgi:rfaE bifunctional protein nucleotidyltransferase chain/domain